MMLSLSGCTPYQRLKCGEARFRNDGAELSTGYHFPLRLDHLLDCIHDPPSRKLAESTFMIISMY